ncbi:Beta-lysine acetyltransferase [Chitinispirillum alkaliphilum]|nr:Beta-lysine acetyltransferase [Chitinispirillum alkaliphilum]
MEKKLTKPDTIKQIGKSVIQHGILNDRVYIMKIDSSDSTPVISEALTLAEKNQYSKVFAKVPAQFCETFKKHGFISEACIKRPQNAGGDMFFMSVYCKDWRKEYNDYNICSSNLSALENCQIKALDKLPEDLNIEECSVDYAEEMAQVYSIVFESYPFPIDNPEYIRKTIDEGIRYFCIKNSDNKIIALSSVEIDPLSNSAEMTDFATLPEARGKNCAAHLLRLMEEKIPSTTTPYTIARAVSYPMNSVFARNGYTFAGTLRKNTQIGDTLEDMNVWYKAARQ